jgi:hypothetical protein
MQQPKREERQARLEKKIASKTEKLARKPGAKRAIKRVQALRSQDDWSTRHHLDEYKYALGLFDPKSGICKRIPNPLPVPTAVATLQGMTTVTVANGTCALFLDPWASGNILYVSSAPTTENSVLAWGTAAPNTIMTGTNVKVYRVVSAWMGVADMTPALSKTGIISSGSVSIRQLGSGGSSDTIRDSYWVNSVPNATSSKYVGGVYIPTDPSCSVFQTTPPTEYLVPTVFVSALTAGCTLSIQYVVNYEYVPAGNQTDLLSTAIGPVGDISKALAHAGEIRNVLKEAKALHSSGFPSNLMGKIMSGLGAVGGVAATLGSVLSKI